MKIVTDYPPNIEAIRDCFGAAALQYAIYTYGDTVYVPSGETLPDHLVVHESVHIRQQGETPEYWWKLYLSDPNFRLTQELEAYREQYKFFSENAARPSRRLFLNKIAKDLSGPLYGRIISFDEAKQEIKL